jgi:16S rRNA (guanine527-N7)-methyltransferase
VRPEAPGTDRAADVGSAADLLLDDPLTGDERLPAFFGAAWPALDKFHTMLVTDGVLRGLVGPREVARLWERHLLNSAAAVPFLPETGQIVDVGSGAGLPGVVIAAMRPDTEVVLLEPMERRCEWLAEVVEALDLPNISIVRGRAEDVGESFAAQAVTARAVAALDKLYRWTLPLLEQGGVLIALKGTRAAAEVAAAVHVGRKLGGGPAEVLEAETLPGLEPTTVVRVVRERLGKR